MDLDDAKRHQHRLVSAADIRHGVHGSDAIGKANAWLAVRITKSVGSMSCAYAFAALALVSLPSAISSGSAVVLVSWISQTFLQLVLLSVIIVGQNVLAAASDARAESDHETLGAVHTLTIAVESINEQQSEILRRLDERVASAAS
jgi:hypothetical protein